MRREPAARPGTAGAGLGEAAVRAALPEFFRPIEVAASLPSTMSRAGELAAAGAREGAIVLADLQTAGRGRLGRAWTTPPGSALMLSLVLRPALPAARTWTVLAAAGVALADAVATLLGQDPGSDQDPASEPSAPGGPTVALKWPNDLLVDGRKAAGLLAERGTAAQAARSQVEGATPVVLGMGVNVTQRTSDFPPELRDRATSLAVAAVRAGTAPPTRLRLLEAWSREFVRRYTTLGADGSGILPAYRRRLGTLGQDVRVDRLAGPPVHGRADSVTPDGSLIVRLPGGARAEIASGDVEHLRRGR